MRVDAEALLKDVPSLLHPGIRGSTYYSSKSDSMVINSDESRKQSDNVANCEMKLRNLIKDVGRNAVPGETSAETKQRVKGL